MRDIGLTGQTCCEHGDTQKHQKPEGKPRRRFMARLQLIEIGVDPHRLRDDLLNEVVFDTQDDARRKLAISRQHRQAAFIAGQSHTAISSPGTSAS
ncbi:hypothetical protein GLR48_01745 [Loktanella sp. M215]|nr:hypothetical protein [Loktanella sp. M215]